MPVYSVNRRRAILLLFLSCVLLLTLDVRGNPVVDRARNVVSTALSPFVSAGRVVATPVKNIWHGATDYQDLRKENEQLRAEIAQQRGDDLAARSIYSDYQVLLTLNGLIANYKRVTARVIGDRTSNFRQTLDIDRGSADGVGVGMAVISPAGLVGKITQVYDDKSVVLLVTDPEYTIECKVSGTAALPPTTTTTDPSTGIAGSGDEAGGAGTTTTVVPGTTTTTTPPGVVDGGAGDVPTTTTTVVTTTTTPVPVELETGGCEGRGRGSLPVMKFVTENLQFGQIGEGDVVATAGGAKSLAPPGIVIGEVVNKIDRASSAGPLLEIELAADLDHLSLVQIVIFRPTSEVPG